MGEVVLGGTFTLETVNIYEIMRMRGVSMPSTCNLEEGRTSVQPALPWFERRLAAVAVAAGSFVRSMTCTISTQSPVA
jgi:hypothetical protein